MLINEFADEGTLIQVMRSLIKFTQAREEMTKELGARATNLSTIAFSGEVRDNATIQVQLADLLVDEVIKEVPIILSVAIYLAKDSEKEWKKTRNSSAWVQCREETGSRKIRGHPPRGISA